jgi:hypothetical protein
VARQGLLDSDLYFEAKPPGTEGVKPCLSPQGWKGKEEEHISPSLWSYRYGAHGTEIGESLM